MVAKLASVQGAARVLARIEMDKQAAGGTMSNIWTGPTAKERLEEDAGVNEGLAHGVRSLRESQTLRGIQGGAIGAGMGSMAGAAATLPSRIKEIAAAKKSLPGAIELVKTPFGKMDWNTVKALKDIIMSKAVPAVKGGIKGPAAIAAGALLGGTIGSGLGIRRARSIEADRMRSVKEKQKKSAANVPAVKEWLARHLGSPEGVRSASTALGTLKGGAIGAGLGGATSAVMAPEGSGWDAMKSGAEKGFMGGAALGGLGGFRAGRGINSITPSELRELTMVPGAAGGAIGGVGLGYLAGDRFKNPQYAQMAAMGQA